MDFGVVSDHGNLLTAADFFRGYADAEDIGDFEDLGKRKYLWYYWAVVTATRFNPSSRITGNKRIL